MNDLLENLRNAPLATLRQRLESVTEEEKILRALIGARSRIERKQQRQEEARQIGQRLEREGGSNAS